MSGMGIEIDRRRLALCRTCRASIFWAQFVGGKRAPIDYQPRDDGSIRIVGFDTREHVPLVSVVRQVEQVELGDDPDRYVNHWATCANPPPKAPKTKGANT